ncbi:hypothetical protein P692DRAFT_20761016, partial [Suillus brevipes Sb2]
FRYIRTLLVMKAAMNAIAVSLPSLASVLAFVTCSLTGHSLTSANVFTSLTLFNLARMPLMFLPLSLSSIADAATACVRLLAVFETETLNETLVINADMNTAVKAEGASFTWDSSPPSA